MFDDINSCRFLFLKECCEPEENALRVVVEEASAGGPSEDLEIVPGKFLHGVTPIESGPISRCYELVWPSYIAYGIRNESFTSWDDSEDFVGQLFRIYSRSRFREYIAQATFANSDYPGPYCHWSLVCLRHIVDVVGCQEPVVRRLHPDPSTA